HRACCQQHPRTAVLHRDGRGPGPGSLLPSRSSYSQGSIMILVTGAAGFIGFHTCQLLLRDGEQVLGIDNLNSYYDVNLKLDRLAQLEEEPGFVFQRLDIADRATLPLVFEQYQIDRVIHLAAQAGVRYSIEHPNDYVDANLVG